MCVPSPPSLCSHRKEGTRGADTETADQEQGGGDGNKRVTIKPSSLIILHVYAFTTFSVLCCLYITPPSLIYNMGLTAHDQIGTTGTHR